ncbi:MAG: PilW family protein [Pseudomonadota bacterium]
MTQHTHSQQSGLTLIELMVAMAIGLILVLGTFVVYTNGRAAYATNDNFTLMQENARFALGVIEPDLELAGYWGQHNDASAIRGSANDREATGTPLGGIANDCAENWVVQFDEHVSGFNDVEAGWSDWACIPNRFTTDTDIFAVRRVQGLPANALQAGQFYLRSSEAPRSEVFLGNNEPTSLPASSLNYALVANAYYVSPYSLAGANGTDNYPSLRRVQLVEQGGTPTMVDTEITTGVQDMQIQYGIGPVNVAGTRGGVAAYVSDIENLTAPNTMVRSMRVWLLMRSENPEIDHFDDIEYQLGDKVVGPFNDNFRRIVASRTVFFRNLH